MQTLTKQQKRARADRRQRQASIGVAPAPVREPVVMQPLVQRRTFRDRKRERTEHYFRFVYGWVLQPCVACAGSGYYDHNGSPPCGSCEGTGRTRERGPKALAVQ